MAGKAKSHCEFARKKDNYKRLVLNNKVKKPQAAVSAMLAVKNNLFVNNYCLLRIT